MFKPTGKIKGQIKVESRGKIKHEQSKYLNVKRIKTQEPKILYEMIK